MLQATLCTTLLQHLLIHGRVVLQGHVGRRGDDPLALLELLGLRLGRHFGGAGRLPMAVVSSRYGTVLIRSSLRYLKRTLMTCLAGP